MTRSPDARSTRLAHQAGNFARRTRRTRSKRDRFLLSSVPSASSVREIRRWLPRRKANLLVLRGRHGGHPSIDVRRYLSCFHYYNVKQNLLRALALLLVISISAYGGFWWGVRKTGAEAAESLRAVVLSESAVRVVFDVMLLKAHRANQPDRAADRLESMLDFAVLNVARDYTAARDPLHTAEQALEAARTYRAAHPHANSLASVASQVETALASAPAP